MKIVASVGGKVVFDSTFDAIDIGGQYSTAQKHVERAVTQRMIDLGKEAGEVETAIKIVRSSDDDAVIARRMGGPVPPNPAPPSKG